MKSGFKKKALENKQIAADEINTRKRQNIEETICQNFDKLMSINNPVVEEFDDIEEELPIPRSENIYEHAERALKP